MKNFCIVVLLLHFYVGTQAQVFVSPNSYIYAKDQIVFVNQDINLQANGNIYLRNEAQLIQGTSGTSTNTGLGKLSIYQEGTSDNFDYNYWCSPVGNASAAVGNESFGIAMLGSPLNTTTSNNATILAAGALNGVTSPLSIAQNWIYKYINLSTYSQWILVGSASTLSPGEGFTMKGTSGTDVTLVDGVQNNPGSAQRYDFRGKPNDGNISVAVGAGNQTLTGNPYPSALHVNAFLLDSSNAACDGIAYYWEQNKTVNSHFLTQYQGGYGTYSPISVASNGIYLPATFDTYDGSGNLNTSGTSSGLAIERKYAPVGQGFMVKGMANGVVTLKNSHRIFYKESGPLSQFERALNLNNAVPETNSEVSHFRINTIINNQFTKQIALAFLPEATDGPDRGIDAVSPSDSALPVDIWFDLDSQKYVIQGIQFNIEKRIRLGVKASNNTTLRFYIPELANFDQQQPIFIYDSDSNSYHDIRTSFYDVTLDEGIYINRFEVTFTSSALQNGEPEEENIFVSHDNFSSQINISNPKLAAIKEILVFDIGGKLVEKMTCRETAEKFQISSTGLSDGIYMVKIETDKPKGFSTKISVMSRTN